MGILFKTEHHTQTIHCWQGVFLGVQDAPEGAAVCKLSDGSWVGFYQVIPLTENELEYKIQHSTDEMLEYMEDVDHVVYFQRPDTNFESH